MTEYRRDLPPRPDRMMSLPIDDRGYPVPYFVAWIDGKPDFRVMDPEKWARCVKQKLCWCCGQKLGRHLCFAIGPMCVVNMTTSEPPVHLECARYAAISCPFMLRPTAKRREAALPEGTREPPGLFLERNPGVMVLLVTNSYRVFKVPAGGDAGAGYLIKIGDPELIECWTQGRKATFTETMASVDSGMPFLRQAAELDGADAQAALTECYDKAAYRLRQATPP